MQKPLFAIAMILALSGKAFAQTWNEDGENAQHTALSAIASQPLQDVHWTTPVDLDPQYASSGDLYIHYGSPVITSNNTVIVPVKTGAWGGFELQAFNGATGASIWTQSTNYTLPSTSSGYYSWTPPYSPAISGNTLYYAGDGGTVYERGSLNSGGSVTPTQVAFYGSLSNYTANQAAYNADVAISTPITTDSAGDIYFGYQATSGAPGGLTSGIARISSTGVGTFFEASQLSTGGGPAMTQVITNSAPALSPNGSTVYVAMSDGYGGEGRLVALNSTTLTPESNVLMMDPKTNTPAIMINDGTASPMVGPDGDVYMGVLDNAGTSRGWMEHYSANLSVTKPTGGFGWDDTASIVPASMVPSYHGTSSYLIMTKYNNYADPGTGGNGQNMLAILDPNATQTDTRPNTNNGAEGATIMQQVLTIVGPTPDPEFGPNYPLSVHEWCDNSAVVDPATDSVLVNSEDGSMYRWNLLSDTLTQTVNITDGLGEAYTPTEIGPDGTVYGINNAKLWAIGASPGSGVFSTWSASGGGNWSDVTNWSIAVPGNAGDTVTFDSSISGSNIVNLNGNESAGTINFYSNSSYTIAQGSSGTLTLNNGSSPAIINDLLGNHTISAPVYLASNTTLAVGQTGNVLTISGNISGPGGITLASTATTLSNGTVLLSGSNNYSGGTTVNGGKLVIGASGALSNGSVTITGGTLQLAMNTGAAQMTSLSITGGALDLTNNHINIADPGGLPDDSTFTTILGYVENNSIISTAGYAHYGIGVVDSNDNVSGANVPANTIEVAYTLYGDANLDGKVDATDFGIFAPNFGATGFTLGWEGGDFDYDGSVDATDFGLFAPNFGLSDNGTDISLPTADWAALDAFAAANGLLTDVPEPGPTAAMMLVFAGFLTRRRWRSMSI